MALVERLASTYLASDGEIRTVLGALFASDEFWQAAGSKFKTPYEYVISTLRATGQSPQQPRAIADLLQQFGMPLYGCPTPNGYANTQQTWLNPEAMTRRLSFATRLGLGQLRGLSAANSQINPQTNPQINPQTNPQSPPDPQALAQTLGNRFSASTQTALAQSPESLRAALILGSPELMWR
jgi:uncharacterized protein (DUF1800 family)